MLVTVQLVHDLGIPFPGIVFRTVSRPKEPLPRAAGYWITMPVDFRAKVDGIKVEQRDLVPQKSLGFRDGPVNPGRKILADESKVLPMSAVKAPRGRLGKILLE